MIMFCKTGHRKCLWCLITRKTTLNVLIYFFIWTLIHSGKLMCDFFVDYASSSSSSKHTSFVCVITKSFFDSIITNNN